MQHGLQKLSAPVQAPVQLKRENGSGNKRSTQGWGARGGEGAPTDRGSPKASGTKRDGDTRVGHFPDQRFVVSPGTKAPAEAGAAL